MAKPPIRTNQAGRVLGAKDQSNRTQVNNLNLNKNSTPSTPSQTEAAKQVVRGHASTGSVSIGEFNELRDQVNDGGVNTPEYQFTVASGEANGVIQVNQLVTITNDLAYLYIAQDDTPIGIVLSNTAVGGAPDDIHTLYQGKLTNIDLGVAALAKGDLLYASTATSGLTHIENNYPMARVDVARGGTVYDIYYDWAYFLAKEGLAESTSFDPTRLPTQVVQQTTTELQTAVEEIDTVVSDNTARIDSLEKGAILAGNYDGATNVLTYVSGAGLTSTPPFVLGADLPAAAATIDTYYVYVQSDGEYPAASGNAIQTGDIIYCDGTQPQWIIRKGSAAAPVTTVHGRTGDVVAQPDDIPDLEYIANVNDPDGLGAQEGLLIHQLAGGGWRKQWPRFSTFNFGIEDFQDRSKLAMFDNSALTAPSIRQIKMPDRNVNLGGVPETFIDTANYLTGDTCIYQDELWQFTADHLAGAWIGTDATNLTLNNAEQTPYTTTTDLTATNARDAIEEVKVLAEAGSVSGIVKGWVSISDTTGGIQSATTVQAFRNAATVTGGGDQSFWVQAGTDVDIKQPGSYEIHVSFNNRSGGRRTDLQIEGATISSVYAPTAQAVSVFGNTIRTNTTTRHVRVLHNNSTDYQYSNFMIIWRDI